MAFSNPRPRPKTHRRKLRLNAAATHAMVIRRKTTPAPPTRSRKLSDEPLAKPPSASRPFGGQTLTEEQGAIVDAAVWGDDIKVAAFAGTGKTTTLEAVAKALPKHRILYLTFSKTAAMAADQRFPEHVKAVTAHALAYREIGHHYQARLNSRLWARDLAAQGRYPPRFDREPVQLAATVLATVHRFASSADPKIKGSHVPRLYRALFPDAEEWADFIRAIVGWAKRLWTELIDPRGVLPITPDTYLKLWQLATPHLDYETILFDEAQDASPVMLDIVSQQTEAQQIFCGDSHQQIYSWRAPLTPCNRWMPRCCP